MKYRLNSRVTCIGSVVVKKGVGKKGPSGIKVFIGMAKVRWGSTSERISLLSGLEASGLGKEGAPDIKDFIGMATGRGSSSKRTGLWYDTRTGALEVDFLKHLSIQVIITMTTTLITKMQDMYVKIFLHSPAGLSSISS